MVVLSFSPGNIQRRRITAECDENLHQTYDCQKILRLSKSIATQNLVDTFLKLKVSRDNRMKLEVVLASKAK